MSLNSDTSFLIRPLGGLYFGPPRSFNAGEAHRGTSLFPPPQSAFQGMVRSQLLRAAGVDFVNGRADIPQLVGPPDALPLGWQLEGPFPARTVERLGRLRLEPWLPAPRHLFRVPGDDRGETLRLGRPLNGKGLPSLSGPTVAVAGQPVPVGLPQYPGARPAGGWLSAAALQEVLQGKTLTGRELIEGWSDPLPPFVHWEEQPGLALERDRHGQARHGMLYFLRRVRFQQATARPSGFYGRLQAPRSAAELPADALHHTLGAAGRKSVPVAFEPAPPMVTEWEQLMETRHLPEELEEDHRFWLISCTPVRPTSVWSPVRSGVLPPGVELKVEAVLSSGTQSLGGLRYADRKALMRDNRLFLQAGTAWLFRLTGADAARRRQTLERLHAHHPLGEEQDAAFGYGFTLVGVVTEEDQDHE